MEFHCTHPLENPSRKQSEQKGSECLSTIYDPQKIISFSVDPFFIV